MKPEDKKPFDLFEIRGVRIAMVWMWGFLTIGTILRAIIFATPKGLLTLPMWAILFWQSRSWLKKNPADASGQSPSPVTGKGKKSV